jgi:hypothetical protein
VTGRAARGWAAITEASATLFGRLSAAGACLSGPPFTICLSAREIYYPGWETGGPGDHVADVAFPFSTAAK